MDGDAVKKRFRARRAELKQKGLVAQLVITVAGVALTLLGLAMLVLPGPAFVVLPLGLAMLSVRFAWAAKLLDISIDTTAKATHLSLRTKIIAGVFAALAVAAAAIGFFVAND